GVEDRHDPRWHANLQDSRAAFVGEERVLVPCSHFRSTRVAGRPVADDRREGLRRRETPGARFLVVRVWTIRLNAAGTPERRPVVENGRWRIRRQGGSPQQSSSLHVGWSFVEAP